MEAKVHEACEEFQTSLTESLQKNSGLGQVIAPILMEAHKYFMNDEEERALELYRIAQQIAAQIMDTNSQDLLDQGDDDVEFRPVILATKVTFEDIIGMEGPKKIVRKEFIDPVSHQDLLLVQPRGVVALLLFGFSGCGKTRFVEAIAHEANVPFSPILVSQLQSKWKGESEKLVTKLFETVRKHKAAVVFLDEVEPLMGNRSENDSLGTLKSLFLQQTEGIDSRNSDSFILLVAATNKSQQLDPAFVSRFKHKVLVRPPSHLQRKGIIARFLATKYDLRISANGAETLAAMTDGFSGRDIVTVLDTLNFLPMQKVLTATKFMRLRGGLYKIAEGKGEFVNASPIDIGTDNIIPPILREDDVVSEFKRRPKAMPAEPPSMFEFYAKQLGASDDDYGGTTAMQSSDFLDLVVECVMCVVQ